MIEEKIADNEQTPILKSRRRFSLVEKMEIVRASQVPGQSVAQVAQAYAVNANQLFKWRRQYLNESNPVSRELVPIHVEPSQRSQEDPECARIEIELGTGCRIVVHGDASPILLRTALKSLGQ